MDVSRNHLLCVCFLTESMRFDTSSCDVMMNEIQIFIILKLVARVQPADDEIEMIDRSLSILCQAKSKFTGSTCGLYRTFCHLEESEPLDSRSGHYETTYSYIFEHKTGEEFGYRYFNGTVICSNGKFYPPEPEESICPTRTPPTPHPQPTHTTHHTIHRTPHI